MGRTHKDERAKKTVSTRLEVLKNDDGTYEIFFKGELVCSRVPERWLDQELCVRYGFCGDEFDAIMRQLNDSGKASVAV